LKKKPNINAIVHKVMDYIAYAKTELIVLGAVLLFDLLTKTMVANTMALNTAVTLVPKFAYFFYTHNYSAAFSSDFGLGNLIGADGVRLFFLVITLVAVVLYFICLYGCRKRRKFLRVMLALMIAGALGNFVDRLFLGYVRDFIYLEYFGLDIPILGGTGFAIFNFADAALVSSVIGVIVYILFMYKKDTQRLSTTASKDTQKSVQMDAQESVQVEGQENLQTSPIENTNDLQQKSNNENTI